MQKKRVKRNKKKYKNDIKEIHFHLGAHKTATTYMQHKIIANNALLDSNNILFLGQEFITPTLCKALLPGTSMDRSVDLKMFKVIFSGETVTPVHRLVLSDENLPTVLKLIYLFGEFYPHLRKRMKLIKSFFRQYTDVPVKIFFCLRSYDTYLPSAYGEFIRHNPFVPFSEYISKVDIHRDVSWPHIIDIFSEVFGPENITLWRYEDFKKKEQLVFSELLGMPDIQLKELEESTIRNSASHEAIKRMEELAGTKTPEELRMLLPELVDQFPKDGKNKGFSPFSDEVKQALNNRYLVECEELKEHYKML